MEFKWLEFLGTIFFSLKTPNQTNETQQNEIKQNETKPTKETKLPTKQNQQKP